MGCVFYFNIVDAGRVLYGVRARHGPFAKRTYLDLT
jgi:hypothetical protein